jgi:hypothetical protein
MGSICQHELRLQVLATTGFLGRLVIGLMRVATHSMAGEFPPDPIPIAPSKCWKLGE